MARRNAAEVLTGLVVLVVAGGFLTYAVAHSGQSAIGAGYPLLARFDNIAGLNIGAPVRLAGVQVGRVDSETVDPKTYLAVVGMTLRQGIEIPKDSSVEVASESLLGGEYLSIQPGADDKMLAPGQRITITQGAVSIEQLLGKFIFSATNIVGAMGSAAKPAPPAGSASPPGSAPPGGAPRGAPGGAPAGSGLK